MWVTLEPTEPVGGDQDDERNASSPSQRQANKGTGAINVLGAAMLAVGDILEPEKTTVEIVQTDDDPIDDLPFNIDFGNLPPLD